MSENPEPPKPEEPKEPEKPYDENELGAKLPYPDALEEKKPSIEELLHQDLEFLSKKIEEQNKDFQEFKQQASPMIDTFNQALSEQRRAQANSQNGQQPGGVPSSPPGQLVPMGQPMHPALQVLQVVAPLVQSLIGGGGSSGISDEFVKMAMAKSIEYSFIFQNWAMKQAMPKEAFKTEPQHITI